MSRTVHANKATPKLQKAYRAAAKKEIASRLGVSEKKAAQIFSRLNRLASRVDWATPVEKQSPAQLTKKLHELAPKTLRRTEQRAPVKHVSKGH